MAAREILVTWSVTNTPGGVSVLYFDSTAATADAQRSAIGDCLTAMNPFLANVTEWTVEQIGRELEPSTGTLTGQWLSGTPETGVGTASGGNVPNAAQAMVRISTGIIVNGRFLKGRWNIPGVDESANSGGHLTGAASLAMGTAADALASAGVGLSVWHRPKLGTGGSLHAASAATMWDEFSVLRRRR